MSRRETNATLGFVYSAQGLGSCRSTLKLAKTWAFRGRVLELFIPYTNRRVAQTNVSMNPKVSRYRSTEVPKSLSSGRDHVVMTSCKMPGAFLMG